MFQVEENAQRTEGFVGIGVQSLIQLKHGGQGDN